MSNIVHVLTNNEVMPGLVKMGPTVHRFRAI